MHMVSIRSTVLFICALIAVVVAVIFLISIGIHIFQQYLKKLNEREDPYAADGTLTYITVLIYFELFAIFGVISCATLSIVANPTECNIIAPMWIVLFHVSRCILYFIFIRRISVVFEDTIFSFDRKHVTIDYILIIIYFILYLLFPLITNNFHKFDNLISPTISTRYDPQYGCVFKHFPVLSHGIYLQDTSSLYHIFMIIYSLYLFTRPLRQLLKFTPDQQTSRQLYLIMIKYCVLHTTLIIFSCIFITFCVLFPFGFHFSVIDSFLNGMMLMLLDPVHNGTYKAICCLPHLVCKKCVWKPSDTFDLGAVSVPKRMAQHQPPPVHEEEREIELQVEEKQVPEVKMKDVLKEKMRQRYDPKMKDLMRNKMHQRCQSALDPSRVMEPIPESIPGASAPPEPGAPEVDESASDYEASSSLEVPVPLNRVQTAPVTHAYHPCLKSYVLSIERKPTSHTLGNDELMNRLQNNALRLLNAQSERL